jgi:hypothetical protein
MGQHDYVLRGATPSSDVTTVGARVPSSTVEAQVEDEMRMIKNRARAVPPTRPVTAGLPTKRDIAAGLYITKQGLLPATITAPRSVPTVHSSGTWSDLSKGDILSRVHADMEVMSVLAAARTFDASERALESMLDDVRHPKGVLEAAVLSTHRKHKSHVDNVSLEGRKRSWEAHWTKSDTAPAASAGLAAMPSAHRSNTQTSLLGASGRGSGSGADGSDFGFSGAPGNVWQRRLMKARALPLMKPRPLQDEAPDTLAAMAASRWDARHRTYTASSKRLAHATNGWNHGDWQLSTSVTDVRFQHSLNNVRRNRYIPPTPPADDGRTRETTGGEASHPRRSHAPRPLKNIWEPRLEWAESGDYFDTEAIRAKRFAMDWKRTMDMGLVKIIMQNDDGDDDGIEDEDGDGIPDEVEEVGEILWKHSLLLHEVFVESASLSRSLDLVGMNAFSKFVVDCALFDKTSNLCQLSHFDQMFLRADALGKKQERLRAEREGSNSSVIRKRPVTDQEHTLSVSEFFVCIVLIAINKYVLTDKVRERIEDVSCAVERLLAVDVESRYISVSRDADVFRRCHCYQESSCAVLCRREAELRVIFDFMACFGSKGKLVHDKVPTITLLEWLSSLKHLNFIGPDVSERDSLRCFSWSRMVVEDSQTPNGHFKNTVLPFEGFMEAVCRVAAQKALPTKEELNAPEECGQWMVELRTTRATDYDEMLMQRATEWGSPPPADYPHTLECTIVLLAFEVRDSKRQTRPQVLLSR